MKALMAMSVAAAIAACAGPAEAGCAFGNNSLGGSIGPGQTDGTRSYSVEGRAVLSVAGAQDAGGSPGISTSRSRAIAGRAPARR